jgi:hypothetical protein
LIRNNLQSQKALETKQKETLAFLSLLNII